MKKFFMVLCLCTLFALLTGCGEHSATQTEFEPQEPTITLAEYKSMVSDFNAKVMDESVILANAGMYEYNYWKAFSDISTTVTYGDMDYDVMVNNAMEWLSENSDSNADTVKSTYDDLMATYNTILGANVDEEIPTEISDLVSALLGAYYQLYTIVTDPSEVGTMNEFVLTLKECTDAITMFNSDLASALKS